MPNDSENKLNTPLVGEVLRTAGFEDFVREFFHETGAQYLGGNVGLKIMDILTDQRTCGEFMRYCMEHDFVFESDSEDYKNSLTIFLGVMDTLRRKTTNAILEILGQSQSSLIENLKNHSTFLKGGANLWSMLSLSVEAGIPVNNYGDVLYLMHKKDENLFEVFSFERNIHTVNARGEVVFENIVDFTNRLKHAKKSENWEERSHTLKRISDLTRCREMITSKSYGGEKDAQIHSKIRGDFEKKTGFSWDSIRGDKKEERVYTERFKSYIFFQILEENTKFEVLQSSDTSGPDNVVVVGGTDVGD